jgi:hypothetical protein
MMHFVALPHWLPAMNCNMRRRSSKVVAASHSLSVMASLLAEESHHEGDFLGVGFTTAGNVDNPVPRLCQPCGP